MFERPQISLSHIRLSHSRIMELAKRTAEQITAYARELGVKKVFAYAVPRGGIPAAYAIQQFATETPIVLINEPADAMVFIDDIIDSGETMRRYCDDYPETAFFALIDKTNPEETFEGWAVFPWEVSSTRGDHSATDNIIRLLEVVGEDPTREGLRETPARVVKAWEQWCSGYGKDPADVLKVFEDGAENYDQMVLVKDIPFYSHCEHHMAPIFGTASVAYIPNGKIVGLSKLSRLVDIYARRLQVQERMTNQIAESLHSVLAPLGVGVMIRARHLCMESRGVCQQGHETISVALRGAMKDEPQTRDEFLKLAK